MLLRALCISFCLVSPGILWAQDAGTFARDSSSFYDMSLEELMKVEVTVASSKALTPRESPGILTIITEDEIRKSGASELMEILEKVPGFGFGMDVEGVIGIGVRGNWAHEGKVLMLLDGHELNEDLFSAIAMGGHYSTALIKQIEIIRGPGSAIYGGNAEYAVINIISRHAADGISLHTSYGQMSRQFASRNIALTAARPFGNAHLDVSAFLSQSNRSQEEFTDNNGVSYDMSEQSAIKTAQYAMNFTWKELRVSGLADQYHLHQRDGYESVLSRTYPTNFDSYHFLAEYDFKVNEKLSLTPTVKYKYQLPWMYDGESFQNEFTPYKVSVENLLGTLNAKYDISTSAHLTTGVEAIKQQAKQQLEETYFENGSRTVQTNNLSAYTQLFVKHRIANLTVGARYNYNDRYADAFVPRIGLTRVFDRWHLKLLYSSAFRSPSIENINSSEGIKPERTTVMEMETGYELSKNAYLTANIFDVTTQDAIIFYYDVDNIDAYKNEGKNGTRGLELEYRIKTAAGYMNLNYAYSTSNGKETNQRYSVPGKKGLLIGFPANKITMMSNLRLTHKVNISPAFNWVDKRYDIFTDLLTGEQQVRSFKPAMYADLMINFEEVLAPGLVIQAGCINIFDSKVVYIQPYNSNHAALPGASREYRLKISYELRFNK